MPLSREMILLLEHLRRNQPDGHGDFIFSKTNGQKPFNSFSKDMKMFRSKMAATLQELEPGAVMRWWVLHDTRRVVRTGLSALDVPDMVGEIVIGHGKTGIRRVYDQYRFLPQTRTALSRWAARLMLVLEGSVTDFNPDNPEPT